MTAREWLEANKKEPFESACFPYWYWGSIDGAGWGDKDDNMLLPEKWFEKMTGTPSYSKCREYTSKEEAIADFEQAYNQLPQ